MQCPKCGKEAVGDVCAACGAFLTEETPRWYAEGIAHLAGEKQFTIAQELLKEGLQRYPTSSMLWFNAGVLAEIRKNAKDAAAYYQKAYTLKPTSEKYRQTLERVLGRPVPRVAPPPQAAAPAPPPPAPITPPAETPAPAAAKVAEESPFAALEAQLTELTRELYDREGEAPAEPPAPDAEPIFKMDDWLAGAAEGPSGEQAEEPLDLTPQEETAPPAEPAEAPDAEPLILAAPADVVSTDDETLVIPEEAEPTATGPETVVLPEPPMSEPEEKPTHDETELTLEAVAPVPGETAPASEEAEPSGAAADDGNAWLWSLAAEAPVEPEEIPAEPEEIPTEPEKVPVEPEKVSAERDPETPAEPEEVPIEPAEPDQPTDLMPIAVIPDREGEAPAEPAEPEAFAESDAFTEPEPSAVPDELIMDIEPMMMPATEETAPERATEEFLEPVAVPDAVEDAPAPRQSTGSLKPSWSGWRIVGRISGYLSLVAGAAMLAFLFTGNGPLFLVSLLVFAVLVLLFFIGNALGEHDPTARRR